jgi:hypothetical protein
MTWLGDLFKAVAAVFGWAKHRSEQQNTEEMKEWTQRKDNVRERDKEEAAVADRDLEEVRRRLSL